MNQCNSTDRVSWGQRMQRSEVSYSPFCGGGMQVAVGLNLINYSVDFNASVTNVQSNRFTITYSLLSQGDYQCTSIGGTSYAVFCDESKVAVSPFTVNVACPSHESCGQTVDVPTAPINCSLSGGDTYAIV